ncbi:hypothetical protein MBLNU230_g6870t1 [Neophaeotheca triangularis]
MTAPQPAVVLVHGAWHTPAHYAPLIHSLQNQNFLVTCPQLPSQTPTLPLPPTATLATDIATINDALTTLTTAGHPIILLMHSYGSIVGSAACSRDLIQTDRLAAGHGPGGVIHLVYFAGFVIPAGSSAYAPWHNGPPPWIDVDDATGTQAMKDPRDAFYSHLSLRPEEQDRWLARTVFCPMSVCCEVVPQVPYPAALERGALGATYVVCKGDRVFPAEAQEAMAKGLGERARVRYCEGGHCAMIGFEEEIAGVVGEVWRESEIV